MKRTFRLIGGPKHGELIAVQTGYTITFPVLETHRAMTSEAFPYWPVSECRYERRKVDICGWTRLEVMAPVEMSEAELSRRLADFIEGCGGK